MTAQADRPVTTSGGDPLYADALVLDHDKADVVPFGILPDGSLQLQFYASTGLYQFSVIADAHQFNWEELYVTYDGYGNVNQRTGPWDFDELNKNKPLVPSYWVELNGRRLGLWFFQRVSLEDIENRRFRGRMAFHIGTAGEATLKLTPYRPMNLRWMSARVEPDPEDHLESLPFLVAGAAGKTTAAEWASPAYWDHLRKNLPTMHAMYAEPLCKCFDWVCARSEFTPNDIQLLLAAWRLDDRADARAKALREIDNAIARPHWGNPQEDAYSHNGDMSAAIALRSLAWAYHAFQGELGEERRARLLAKLALQGQRFFEQSLLNRDYWGGSILQDHGWQSHFSFGTAALALLGVLPQAEVWAAYAIGRTRRSLKAMPRDGVIPPSSYASLYLYVDELTHYRDALLAAGGGDILDNPPFLLIVDYVIAVLREQDHRMVVSTHLGGDSMPFIGGNAFFNRIATKYQDSRAARLAALLLETPPVGFYHPTQETGYYAGVLWGLLSHDPTLAAVDELPRPQGLISFEDSGLAYYRDDLRNVTLSVQCGPWCGYNAYRRAPGPCDRMGVAPGGGHFEVAIGPEPLLVTPDAGYRLHSALCTCLLIDGCGQHGDVGYPMSIPSKRHHGERIQDVEWDEVAGKGIIRLLLTPAYPDELGVVAYTREFVLAPERRIVCRDHVVLNQPRRLTWLFQGKREHGLALDNEWCARFGNAPSLRLEPRGNIELTASIRETEVVWAYASASGFKPFDHVRYDSVTPITTALMEFLITW